MSIKVLTYLLTFPQIPNLLNQIFQVISQIFHENEHVDRFSVGSGHGDILCTLF